MQKLHDDIVKNMTPFCDMDGVLVDADTGLKIMGKNWDQKHGYDFWTNLPRHKHVDYLWDACHKIGNPPHILTAYQHQLGLNPVGDDFGLHMETVRGKYDWCHKHLTNPPDPKRFHCVYGKNKSLYAVHNGHPNLLIDDFHTNIKRWREAGGIGILHKNIPNTINTLFDMGILKE